MEHIHQTSYLHVDIGFSYYLAVDFGECLLNRCNTGKEILLILSNLISKSATYTRPDRSQIEHAKGLIMSDMKSLNSK